MTTQEKPDWPDKDKLPTESELYELLKAMRSCTVADHYLSPDERGVWITNPYGIDCGLWQELTVEHVSDFLADMAGGKIYGPTP